MVAHDSVHATRGAEAALALAPVANAAVAAAALRDHNSATPAAERPGNALHGWTPTRGMRTSRCGAAARSKLAARARRRWG